MPNPIPAHNPTDGIQSAAYLQVAGGSGNSVVTANKTVAAGKPNPANYSVTLSVSATGFLASLTLTPTVVDAQNNTMPSGSFTLSAAAAASGGTQVLTGVSIPTAAIVAGMSVTVAGFGNALNNGTFGVVATTSTTITVANPNGAAETHAATAQFLVGTVLYKSWNNPNAGTPAWYHPSPFSGYAADVASVSAGGLITALAPGQAVIEVSFPVYDNSQGSQNGLASAAIYTQVVVTVVP